MPLKGNEWAAIHQEYNTEEGFCIAFISQVGLILIGCLLFVGLDDWLFLPWIIVQFLQCWSISPAYKRGCRSEWKKYFRKLILEADY
jgi:hypothetical protein